MQKARTIRKIYRELVSHPFFPLVFWGKAAEGIVTGVHTVDFLMLAIISTVVWAFSDSPVLSEAD